MDEMFFNAASFGHKLCGAYWRQSKASKNDMFEESAGSISHTVCTSAPASVTNLRPHPFKHGTMPDRELIVKRPISMPSATSKTDTSRACPRCGAFRKSGRVSCCAPGGAWFKRCGGLGSNGVDHTWSDGMAACKRKFKCNSIAFMSAQRLLLIVFSVGFVLSTFVCSCNTSSHNGDNHQTTLSQMWHHREVRETQLLRSQWLLVRKLRKRWERRAHVARGHSGMQNTSAA